MDRPGKTRGTTAAGKRKTGASYSPVMVAEEEDDDRGDVHHHHQMKVAEGDTREKHRRRGRMEEMENHHHDDDDDEEEEDDDPLKRLKGQRAPVHREDAGKMERAKEWIDRWWMVGAVIGFAAVGGFLFGYDTGVIGGAILLIKDEFHLSSVLIETVISIALVGAIFGSAVGGPLSDLLGRRKVMAAASMLFTLGSLVMGLAPNITILIMGRFIVGLAIGVAAIVSPVYLAEISPARYRGAVVTVNNLCLTGGQFISYLVDSAFVSVSGGWRWMLGLGALPAAIQLVGIIAWLPESPRWLLARFVATKEEVKEMELMSMMSDDEGGDEFYDEMERMQREREDRAEWERMQARSILCRLRGGTTRHDDIIEGEVEDEMKNIEKTLQSDQALSVRDKISTLLSPAVRRALFVGLGLQIFQQICGINTAMYYSPTILQMAGFESHQSAIWFANIIAFSNALFTGVSLLLMDRAGRRTLLLVSLSGVMVALLSLGLSFYAEDAAYTGYMAVASLVLYVAFFAIGMGPIPWVVNSEIYPASVRGLANGLAATVNWTANLLVSMTFLSYIELVGTSAVFWTFACIAALAWSFVFWFLPETKGVPMERIGELFERTPPAAEPEELAARATEDDDEDEEASASSSP